MSLRKGTQTECRRAESVKRIHCAVGDRRPGSDCRIGACPFRGCVLRNWLPICLALGYAGVTKFDSWLMSARVALATMFGFTAMSHFTPMKKDLISMVPPRAAAARLAGTSHRDR